MRIQWDAPAQKNGALTGYLVNSTLAKTYNALQNELWPTVSVVINSSEATTFYLTNLSPGSTYLVCVQASTSAGVGEAICKNFSSAVSVPGAPEKLRSSKEAEHSLEIEWESPSQKNGALRSYRVEWSLTDTPNDVPVEALSPKSVVVDAYENNSCLLRDLYAGSTYFVCIQASTDTGFGEATCEDFSTNVAVPGSPENVRLEEVTEDSMKIQWDAPPQKNGALTGYLVNSTLAKTHNAPQDELWPTVSVVVNSSEETAFYLANLSPGSTYLVCVQASTSAGVGEAICKNFSTIVSVPGAPERLRSSKEAEHSLEIQWDSPSQRNGELRSYRVNSTLTHTFNDLPVEALSPKSVVVDAYENTSCVLRDLSAGSTYLVCIQASTDTGFGKATCENFSTNIAVPGAPERIRTAEKTEHSLTVVWDPPRQKNGALKSYKVNASLAHTFNDTLLDSWSPTSIVVNASDVQDITLQDLFPASTFLICVQASTIAGFGEAVCENLSTKASAPILQLEPIARASGNGKVSIVVNQVDFNKGPITGYYVLVVDEPCYISEPVKLVNFTSAQEMKLGYYVAAYFPPGQLNASSLNVVVGSGHMIGGFENPPLTDGVAYCFGLLVETNFSGEVLYGYSLAAPLIVNGFSSLMHLVVAIGAFSVFLVIVIVVATLTGCCVRRKSTAAKERDAPFEEAEEYGMSHISTVHKMYREDASKATAAPNLGPLARPDLVRNLQEHKTGAKPAIEKDM
ncbi:tyrosine-protein phosphatase Lar-like [Haemaphysalis longicornis]